MAEYELQAAILVMNFPQYYPYDTEYGKVTSETLMTEIQDLAPASREYVDRETDHYRRMYTYIQ